ncbi:uncharacterized protein METZ01_LOCUS85673 [marine metagenome]|uniref:Uncharacterized protein n=1 Tax=marine metagenome TaxID=408172 RepID=A0A381UXF4_9ZZZZ
MSKDNNQDFEVSLQSAVRQTLIAAA